MRRVVKEKANSGAVGLFLGCMVFLFFLEVYILEGQVAKYNSALRLNSTKHFLPGLAGSGH